MATGEAAGLLLEAEAEYAGSACIDPSQPIGPATRPPGQAVPRNARDSALGAPSAAIGLSGAVIAAMELGLLGPTQPMGPEASELVQAYTPSSEAARLLSRLLATIR